MTSYHVVGDVHGLHAEFTELLGLLGFQQPAPDVDPFLWVPTDGSQLISVGDLVDRGPSSLACLRTVKRMCEAGHARMVIGNHEWKYRRMLRYHLGLDDHPGSMPPGRMRANLELLTLTDSEQADLLEFLDATPAYIELDDGEVLVTHARWESDFARMDRDQQVAACAFGRSVNALSGAESSGQKPQPATGVVDLPPEASLPERARWTRAWRGRATVVWGHDCVVAGAVARIGRTVDVESGACLGHCLSAYSLPEGNVAQVSVREHWRRAWKQLEAAAQVLFPRDRAQVRHSVVHLGLASADDYTAWIELECEERRVSPDPALLQLHRALYLRL